MKSNIYCVHSKTQNTVRITQLKDTEEPLLKRFFLSLSEKIKPNTGTPNVQKTYPIFEMDELIECGYNFDNWIILNAYKHTGYMWDAIRNDYLNGKQFTIAFINLICVEYKDRYGSVIKQTRVKYEYAECKYNYKLRKFTINKTLFEVKDA